MRTYTLTLIVLLLTGAVNAQPTDTRTPAQISREKEQKAYQEAYMEGVRKTDYRPKLYGGQVDNQAAQQLADLFAKRAGRKTSAEKAAEEKANMERYYADLKAKQMAFDKQISVDIQAINIRKPMHAAYIDAGFEAIEAQHYTYDEVTSDKGYVSIKPKRQYYEAKGTLAKLKSIEKTAPFDETMQLILDLQAVPAPVTSLEALQRLAQRFPDKIALINQAMGKSLKTYFIDWGSTYGNNVAVFGVPKAGTRRYMLDSFEALFNHDSGTALAAFDGPHSAYHPIVTLSLFAQFEKDYEKVGRLCRALLLSPNPDDKTKLPARNYRDNAYSRIHEGSQYNYAYRLSKHYDRIPYKVYFPYTTDEVRRIAQAQGLAPMDVVRAITGSQAYDRFKTGTKPGKDENKAWKIDKLIEQLAKEGDADAKAIVSKW